MSGADFVCVIWAQHMVDEWVSLPRNAVAGVHQREHRTATGLRAALGWVVAQASSRYKHHRRWVSPTVMSIVGFDSDYCRSLLPGQEAVNVGAFIMLGTLFGLIVVIFGVVIFLDPEARRSPTEELQK